ncbi:MAG: hypothetical protein Fues2KO_47410 [Fuerstiella sp.]
MGSVRFTGHAHHYRRERSVSVRLNNPDNSVTVPDCSLVLNPVLSGIDSTCNYPELRLPGDSAPYDYSHLPRLLKAEFTSAPSSWYYKSLPFGYPAAWGNPGALSTRSLISGDTDLDGNELIMEQVPGKVAWRTPVGPYRWTSRTVRRGIGFYDGDDFNPFYSFAGVQDVFITHVVIGQTTTSDSCSTVQSIGWEVSDFEYESLPDPPMVDLEPHGGNVPVSAEISDYLDSLGLQAQKQNGVYYTPHQVNLVDLPKAGAYDPFSGSGFDGWHQRFNFEAGAKKQIGAMSVVWPRQTGAVAHFSDWTEMSGDPWAWYSFGNYLTRVYSGELLPNPVVGHSEDHEFWTPMPFQDINFNVVFDTDPSLHDVQYMHSILGSGLNPQFWHRAYFKKPNRFWRYDGSGDPFQHCTAGFHVWDAIIGDDDHVSSFQRSSAADWPTPTQLHGVGLRLTPR